MLQASTCAARPWAQPLEQDLLEEAEVLLTRYVGSTYGLRSHDSDKPGEVDKVLGGVTLDSS